MTFKVGCKDAVCQFSGKLLYIMLSREKVCAQSCLVHQSKVKKKNYLFVCHHKLKKDKGSAIHWLAFFMSPPLGEWRHVFAMSVCSVVCWGMQEGVNKCL